LGVIGTKKRIVGETVNGGDLDGKGGRGRVGEERVIGGEGFL
jgi:hypothetical protein